MWHTEAKVKTKVSKESIWKTWSDVSAWPTWDSQIEWAKLDTGFILGGTGVLKPVGGPKSKFTITECTVNKSVSDTTKLPLCELNFIHTITDLNNGEIELAHRVEMSGPLTFFFSRIIGRKIERHLPEAVNCLVQRVQENKV